MDHSHFICEIVPILSESLLERGGKLGHQVHVVRPSCVTKVKYYVAGQRFLEISFEGGPKVLGREVDSGSGMEYT